MSFELNQATRSQLKTQNFYRVKPILFSCLLLLSLSATAQTNLLSKRVSFNYENLRLKDALADLSNRYQINFSYSSDLVPVRQKVSAHADNMTLSTGLDRLFEKTHIVYAAIGEQIVLRVNQDKSLGSTEKPERKKKPQNEPPKEEAVLVSIEALPPPPPIDTAARMALETPFMQPVRQDGEMHPFDETLLNFEKWRLASDWATNKPGGEKRIAQISILPSIGTNLQKSEEVTNNVSMNLLWGVNGGVDGLEIGTFVNSVKNDVKGVQAAGLGNTVGRNVTGTQVGGIFNFTGGTTRGLQAAGIINVAGEAEAAQAAGLINVVRGDMTGFQASGLFNTAGNAKAIQAAGVLVAEFPDLGPPYKHGTRRVFTKKFKFSLVYVADENEILILAVAPLQRSPGYWKSRGR